MVCLVSRILLNLKQVGLKVLWNCFKNRNSFYKTAYSILKIASEEIGSVGEEWKNSEEALTTAKNTIKPDESLVHTSKPPTVEIIDEYLDIHGNGGVDENSIKPEPEIEYKDDDLLTDSSLSISLDSSQTKRVNEYFEIECTYRGPGRKNLVWRKIGDTNESLKTEVTDGEAKSVTSKLIFDALARKDNGNYSCFADDKPDEYLNLNLNVKGNKLVLNQMRCWGF